MAAVSVIIPNYNRADLVGRTIENMLLQSLKPHEVIVVDDGSTDNSMAVIRSFGNKVKVLQQTNKGPGAARNAGLKISTGDFIQFMDSDDIASLNKLEVQAKVLQEKDADLVYGPWVKVNINGKRVSLQDIVLQLHPLPETRDPLLWFLTDWSFVFQQCLVRKSVIEKVGGYREDIRFLEDGDLFVRLLLNNLSIAHEKHSLTLYRADGANKLTANDSGRRAIDQAKYYEGLLKLEASSLRLRKCMRYLAFKLRLNEATKDIGKHKSEDDLLVKLLHRRLNGYDNYYTFIHWIRNKIYSVRQKVVGHRWHYAYRYGHLTKDQRQLIESMGFELADGE